MYHIPYTLADTLSDYTLPIRLNQSMRRGTAELYMNVKQQTVLISIKYNQMLFEK